METWSGVKKQTAEKKILCVKQKYQYKDSF